MKFLNENLKTLEELKKAYGETVTQLHPELGGAEEDMKILNAEYETLFETVKTVHTNKSGREYYKDTSEIPGDFIKIIDELLKLQYIHIEIIGSFIWVHGRTWPHREILKELGMRWHRTKGCWFLPPAQYKRHSGEEYSMDEIRMMFGVSYEKDTGRPDRGQQLLAGA